MLVLCWLLLSSFYICHYTTPKFFKKVPLLKCDNTVQPQFVGKCYHPSFLPLFVNANHPWHQFHQTNPLMWWLVLPFYHPWYLWPDPPLSFVNCHIAYCLPLASHTTALYFPIIVGAFHQFLKSFKPTNQGVLSPREKLTGSSSVWLRWTSPCWRYWPSYSCVFPISAQGNCAHLFSWAGTAWKKMETVAWLRQLIPKSLRSITAGQHH